MFFQIKGRLLSISFLLIILVVACSQQRMKNASVVIGTDPRFSNTISGQVLDDKGMPLPGVQVLLESGSATPLTATTNPTGKFLFGHLPPGIYSATFSIEGFTEVRQEDVRIAENSGVKLEITLRPTLSEEFVVAADSPIVDTRKTGNSTTFSMRDDESSTRSSRRREYTDKVPSARDSYAYDGVDSDRQTGFFARGVEESQELIIVAANDEWTNSPQGGEQRQSANLEARDRKGAKIGDFPLQHTEVSAEVSGYLARTVLQQEYANPFNEAIEAVYLFPLPSMSAVCDFILEANGHRIMGIVRPREEAEKMYREAREQGMTASLLTQERPNIFTQSIANIEPGGKVSVQITYVERLGYQEGMYEYVFPMVVGPRYISGAPISQKGKSAGTTSAPTSNVPDADRLTPPVSSSVAGPDVDLTVHLDAGMPIQYLQSATHAIEVSEEGTNTRVIHLSKSQSDANRDFVLQWKVSGEKTQFGVLAYKQGPNGFFTLMMQPPLEPSDKDVSPREITFIMDISGSMSGLPIDTSRELVTRALNKLRPQDLFNIVYFSGGNGQLWENPMSPTPSNRQAATKFLKDLKGGGGTEMMAGLHRALAANHAPQFLQMYVFLTDGYVGEDKAILKAIQENKGQARFFAFGIGSSVNRYLIDGIAELGNGYAQMVMPQDPTQAERSVAHFFAAIDSPVLVNPTVEWNGLTISDVYPKKLHDLFAGQTIELVGKYSQKQNGTLIVSGQVGSRTVSYEVSVDLPDADATDQSIAYLWARQRIHELGKLMWTAPPAQKPELISKITEVAMQFRLLSDYTAFIAVDESRIVSDGKPLRVLQPVPRPAGVNAEQGVDAAKINSWGLLFDRLKDGRLRVAGVENNGVAARSGIKTGAVLQSVNHVLVRDMGQLEALLLQLNADTVQLSFENQGAILMPRP